MIIAVCESSFVQNNKKQSNVVHPQEKSSSRVSPPPEKSSSSSTPSPATMTNGINASKNSAATVSVTIDHSPYEPYQSLPPSLRAHSFAYSSTVSVGPQSLYMMYSKVPEEQQLSSSDDSSNDGGDGGSDSSSNSSSVNNGTELLSSSSVDGDFKNNNGSNLSERDRVLKIMKKHAALRKKKEKLQKKRSRAGASNKNDDRNINDEEYQDLLRDIDETDPRFDFVPPAKRKQMLLLERQEREEKERRKQEKRSVIVTAQQKRNEELSNTNAKTSRENATTFASFDNEALTLLRSASWNNGKDNNNNSNQQNKFLFAPGDRSWNILVSQDRYKDANQKSRYSNWHEHNEMKKFSAQYFKTHNTLPAREQLRNGNRISASDFGNSSSKPKPKKSTTFLMGEHKNFDGDDKNANSAMDTRSPSLLLDSSSRRKLLEEYGVEKQNSEEDFWASANASSQQNSRDPNSPSSPSEKISKERKAISFVIGESNKNRNGKMIQGEKNNSGDEDEDDEGMILTSSSSASSTSSEEASGQARKSNNKNSGNKGEDALFGSLALGTGGKKKNDGHSGFFSDNDDNDTSGGLFFGSNKKKHRPISFLCRYHENSGLRFRTRCDALVTFSVERQRNRFFSFLRREIMENLLEGKCFEIRIKRTNKSRDNQLQDAADDCGFGVGYWIYNEKDMKAFFHSKKKNNSAGLFHVVNHGDDDDVDDSGHENDDDDVDSHHSKRLGGSISGFSAISKAVSVRTASFNRAANLGRRRSSFVNANKKSSSSNNGKDAKIAIDQKSFLELVYDDLKTALDARSVVLEEDVKPKEEKTEQGDDSLQNNNNNSNASIPSSPISPLLSTAATKNYLSKTSSAGPTPSSPQQQKSLPEANSKKVSSPQRSSASNNNNNTFDPKREVFRTSVGISVAFLKINNSTNEIVNVIDLLSPEVNNNHNYYHNNSNNNNDAEQEILEKEQDEELFRSTEIAKIFHEEIDKQQKKFLKKENEALDEAAKKKLFLLQNSSMFSLNKNKNGNNLSPSAQRPKYHLQRYHEIVRVCPPSHPLRGYSSKFFQNNNNNNNTKTSTNRNYQFSPNSNIHVNHHISTAMENSSSSSLSYLNNNNNNNTFHHQQHNDETSSNATTSHQNTKNLLLAPGNLRSRSGSAKARSNATSTSNTFHNNAPSVDDMKFFQTNKNFQKSMKDAVDSKCVIVENLPSESLRKVLNVEGIKNKFLGNPSPSEKRSVFTHMIVVTLHATQKVSISQSKFARARFIFEEKPKQQHDDDDDDHHENNNNGPPKKTESTSMGRNNASNLSRFDETQDLLSSNSLQSNSIIDASQYVLPPVGGAASIIFQNNNNQNKNCNENKIREDSSATDFFQDSGETKILPKKQTAPSSPSIVNEDLNTKSKKMLKSIVKKPIFVASCVLPSPSSAWANAVAASSSSSAMTTTKPSMATSLAVTPSQSSLPLASSQNNYNNSNNNNQKQLFFEATNSLFACVSKLHPPNMPANVVTDCITPYFDIVDCTNELELEYAKRKGILHRHQKMSREVGKKLEELTAKRKILEKQVMAEMTKKFEVLDLEHQQQKLDQVKKEERSRVLKLKAKEDRKTRQQQQRSANKVKNRNFSHHNADGDEEDEINVNKHLYSDQESSSDDETRALRVEQQEILARGKSASNISVNASVNNNNSKSSHNFSLRSPPNIIISSSSSATPNKQNNNSQRRTSPNKNPPSSPLSIIPNGSQEDVKDFFYSLQVPTINGNNSAHHHHFIHFSSESNFLQRKEQHQASRTASRSELLRRYDTIVEERVAATERLVSAQKRLKNLRAALDHRHVEHLLEMKKRSEELDNVTQQVKYDLKRVAEDRKKMIADEIASQEEDIQKYSQNKSVNASFTIRPSSAASSKTTVPFAHHHHHQQRKEQSQQQLQNNNSKTFFQSPEFRQSLLRAAGVKTPDPKKLLLLSSSTPSPSEVQQQQQNQSRFSSFRGLPPSSTTPAPKRSSNSKNPLSNYVAFSSPDGEKNKNSNTGNENNDFIHNIASSMKSFEGNVVEGPSPNSKNNFKKNVPNSGVNVSSNTSFSANNKSASFRLKSGAVNLFTNNNNLKLKSGTEDADDEISMTQELQIFESNNNNDITDLQRQSKKNPNQGVPIKRIDSGTFGPMMNEDDNNNNNNNNHARTTTSSNPTGSLPLSSSKPPKKVRVLDLENETQNGKSINNSNNNNRKNSGVAATTASVLNLVSNDNEGGENELIRQENYNNTSASSSDADDELEIWAPMKKANRQQVQQQHGSMRNLKRQSSNLAGNGAGNVDTNNNNSNLVDTVVTKNSGNELIISSEPSATEQVVATGENNMNNNSDGLDETQILRDHSHLPHEALQLLRVGAPTQRLTKEKNKKNLSKNANTSDKNANGAFASAFRDFMGAGANNTHNSTSRSKLDYDPFENPLGLLNQKGLQVELRDNLILYGMWLAHCEQYVRDHMPIDKKSVQDNASLSVQLRSKSSYSRAKTLPPKYSRRYSSDPIMEAQLARVANVAETSGCRFFLNAKQQLARDYVLLIDRSRSMLNGRRWRDAEEAVKVLAPHICKFDPDGITLIFFDHEAVKFDNVMESKEVGALFKSHPPRGSTDLAKALDIAFQDHFNGERGATTILVITDGAPDDREAVKRVIVEAANALGLDGELSISIVQISDDPGATKYLKELDDDLVDAQYDIVDALTSDEVKNISFNELVARSLFD